MSLVFDEKWQEDLDALSESERRILALYNLFNSSFFWQIRNSEPSDLYGYTPLQALLFFANKRVADHGRVMGGYMIDYRRKNDLLPSTYYVISDREAKKLASQEIMLTLAEKPMEFWQFFLTPEIEPEEIEEAYDDLEYEDLNIWIDEKLKEAGLTKEYLKMAMKRYRQYLPENIEITSIGKDTYWISRSYFGVV